jgi:hypothetical protein
VEADGNDRVPGAAVGSSGRQWVWRVACWRTLVDDSIFAAAHVNAMFGAMVGVCAGGALGWLREYVRRRRENH